MVYRRFWREEREGRNVYIISLKRLRLQCDFLAMWLFVHPFGGWTILFFFLKLTTLERKQHITLRKTPLQPNNL